MVYIGVYWYYYYYHSSCLKITTQSTEKGLTVLMEVKNISLLLLLLLLLPWPLPPPPAAPPSSPTCFEEALFYFLQLVFQASSSVHMTRQGTGKREHTMLYVVRHFEACGE